jgi:hypothetical protein
MSAESLRLRALAASLTLLSGAVMVLAGHVANTGTWTIAGFITIPGGLLILAALGLARRADRADGRTAAPSGGRRPGLAATIGATLLSGAVMVFAGYAGSAWGWGLAAPLATVGGLVIGAAFVFDRRGAQATPR